MRESHRVNISDARVPRTSLARALNLTKLVNKCIRSAFRLFLKQQTILRTQAWGDTFSCFLQSTTSEPACTHGLLYTSLYLFNTVPFEQWGQSLLGMSLVSFGGVVNHESCDKSPVTQYDCGPKYGHCVRVRKRFVTGVSFREPARTHG